MPEVTFASSIARQTNADSFDVPGATVGELFAHVFGKHPHLRGYVLDDQGAVRKHVTVFINSRTIADRTALTDAVGPSDVVYVFQALSGG